MRHPANLFKRPGIALSALMVLFFANQETRAQSDTLNAKAKWNSGSILLKDQTILEGFIHHDEKFRVIKFKAKSEDQTELSVAEMSILSMSYYDRDSSKTRSFFSWKVKDDGNTLQGPALYEVVMAMKDFVVLTRKYGLIATTGSRDRLDSNNGKIEYDKVEKIFLGAEGREAELVWLASVKGEQPKSRTSQIQPFFSGEVMKKYMTTHWQDVKRFVKKNRLNLKTKTDLMRALSYYQQLEAK